MTKMEGLIPLVYRAIKRKKTRSYYRCLSSDAAALLDNGEFHANGRMFMATPPPDNRRYISSATAAAGFEMTESNSHAHVHQFMTPPPEKLGGFGEGYAGRHRHSSMKEFPRESSPPERRIEPPRLRKDFMFPRIAGG